jgi:hypothetical protein
MADIIAAGYSRVLVYNGTDTRNVRGYLQVLYCVVYITNCLLVAARIS